MHKIKRPAPFVGAGSSALLVVFLVLVILVFAVLSYVSAKNDYSYSKRMAERKVQYYTACNTAQEMLKDLDHRLLAEDRSLPAQSPLCFTVKISEKQQLCVRLEISADTSRTLQYKIIEWKVENIEKWEGNDKINLISFEE